MFACGLIHVVRHCDGLSGDGAREYDQSTLADKLSAVFGFAAFFIQPMGCLPLFSYFYLSDHEPQNHGRDTLLLASRCYALRDLLFSLLPLAEQWEFLCPRSQKNFQYLLSVVEWEITIFTCSYGSMCFGMASSTHYSAELLTLFVIPIYIIIDG